MAHGKSIPHDSARGHVTGEAAFLDDVLPARNELFVGYVGSPVAKGLLVKVDSTAAAAVPGVVACFTAQDIPGHNLFGPVLVDEPFLAEKELIYIGQPIVIIAAESRQALELARKKVVVEVEEQTPILSIDDAIAAGSLIGSRRKIERGDVEQAFASAAHILEGKFISGGQDHFYLESQVAIAIPGEDRQIVVHSSTQNPTEIQNIVAHMLGVGFHEIICICKRMGGGFGGKETQAAIPAMMAALVASKTRRPARVVFNKDDDMMYTGKRHPYQSNHRVGFDAEGRIVALSIDYHSNGGCSADLSLAVMERTMLHADNAYWLPNVRITGQVYKTNIPSNTAFRGFGGPQGVAAVENILEEIAEFLGKDSLEIRTVNLYGQSERNIAPYGQVIDNNLLPEILSTLARTSDYDTRRADIATFNASSRTHLKGLALTPVKFGISFTKKHLNQGNALVNVYTDGTVQVSTGGTEMGQGLNTKIRQIVADQFGIDPSHVLVMATSTEKSNNTSPTAASASTDLNGAAALRACQSIRQRLANFAATTFFASRDLGIEPSPDHVFFHDGLVSDPRQPGKTLAFGDLVNQAYLERVDLGERAFYATPGVDYNRDTGKGSPFLYYTNGAACCEVLIDRFTGDLSVMRADLLMDLGNAINPGIDRGQIVGGFIQGMGWVTAEELRYSDKGALLSHSPTTYKIPGVQDLPKSFTLDVFPNESNIRNVYGSKAVGEPPFLLALAVFAAVKNALSYAAGVGNIPLLDLPATNEQILLRLTHLSDAPATPLPGSGRLARDLPLAGAAH